MLKTYLAPNFGSIGYTLSLTGILKEVAQEQGTLVIKTKSTQSPQKSFLTVAAIPSLEIGAVNQAQSGIRSTIIAKLVENQIRQSTNEEVSLGEEIVSDSSLALSIKNLASVTNEDSPLAIPEVTRTLEEATLVPNSTLSMAIQTISQKFIAPQESLHQEVGNFLQAGTEANPNLQADFRLLHKITAAAIELGREERRLKGANLARAEQFKEISKEVLSSSKSNSQQLLAAAQTAAKVSRIQRTSQIASIQNRLGSLDYSNLDTIAQRAQTAVLESVQEVGVQQLEQEGTFTPSMQALSSSLIGQPNSSSKTSTLQVIQNSLEAASPDLRNRAFGHLLAASSADTELVAELLQTAGQVDEISIQGALETLNEEEKPIADIAETTRAVVESLDKVNTQRVESLFSGIEVSADGLIRTVEEALGNKGLEYLSHHSQMFKASNKAQVKPVKPTPAGKKVVIPNDSLEADSNTTYSYRWLINNQPISNQTRITGLEEISFNRFQLSMTPNQAGNYNIAIVQTAVSTQATRVLTSSNQLLKVVEGRNELPAEFITKRSSYQSFPGKSISLRTLFFDPQNRSVSFSTKYANSAACQGLQQPAVSTNRNEVTLSLNLGTETKAGTCVIELEALADSTKIANTSFELEIRNHPPMRVKFEELGKVILNQELPVRAKIDIYNPEHSGTAQAYVHRDPQQFGVPILLNNISAGTSTVSTDLSFSSTSDLGAWYFTIRAQTQSETVEQTKLFFVEQADSPKITSLTVNNIPVRAGEKLSLTLAGAQRTLSVKANSSLATSFSLQMYRSPFLNSVVASREATAINNMGEFPQIELAVQRVSYVFSIQGRNGSVLSNFPFEVDVRFRERMRVNKIALQGNISGNLIQRETNIDLQSIGSFKTATLSSQGVSLNFEGNDQLTFELHTPNNNIPSGNFEIQLNFEDPTNQRKAQLKLKDLTFQSSGQGIDMASTQKSEFLFTATRANGEKIATQSSSLGGFDSLFLPLQSSPGMSVDLVQLQASLESMLGENPFRTSLKNLTGSGMSLEVQIQPMDRSRLFALEDSNQKPFDRIQIQNIQAN